MTLTKPKTRRRAVVANKKRTANHHNKTSRYTKSYWPYLPIFAIIAAGFLLNSWLGQLHRSVLGYATNISISGLVAGTNAQRSANGLGALTLNAQLNQAAAAKAADMAANDYWAHTSPSGLTPWYFVSNTGYSYQTAGENLAYGFVTTDDTITGWMNSPGHRANILNGSYQEVGFATLDIPNFQGTGPQTLVVAIYAQPLYASVAVPAPAAPNTQSAPQKSVPTPVATTADQAPTEPAAAEPSAETALEPTTQKQDTVVPASSTTKDAPVAKDTSASKPVARLQVLSSANVAWTQFAVSMLVSVGMLGFLLRHSLAWHKFLVKGEKFVLSHPFFDIGIVSFVVLGAILLQTSGVIR